MKILPVTIGALLGLVLGWAGTQLFGRVSAEAGREESSLERKGSVRVEATTSWLRGRDELTAIRSRGDYLQAREEAIGNGRSPYRGEAFELAWLAEMPLDEIIALLEAGDLHSAYAVRTAFGRWVAEDPEAAFEALYNFPLTRDGRRFAKGPVYAHWVRTDPLGLLRVLEGGTGSLEREGQARDFIAAWAAEAPQQALAALDRLSGLFAHPAEQLPGIREELLTAWLARDEDAPFEWVEALGNESEREALRGSLVIARLGRVPSREAVQYILDRPDDPDLQGRLGNYWREWAQSDPTQAVARMGALPEDHPMWVHEAAFIAQSALVMSILTERTGEAVSALDQVPEGERRRQVLLGMIQGASSNDLALAQELMARLPESREREQAAGFLVELWARKDLAGAGAWLQAQEPSASRDTATQRFALTLAGEDPALAAQWADTIREAGLRDRTRESLHARWRETDAAAAEAWKAGWE